MISIRYCSFASEISAALRRPKASSGKWSKNGGWGRSWRRIPPEPMPDTPANNYCADEDILRPIYDFLKAPDTRTTLYDLMDKCLDSFFKSCRDDMEYQCSEESFEESCAANDYEFLGNGKMYN